MASLCIICIFLFIAVFCYVLAPDNSPNADWQTIEIQAKPPGYSQQYFRIPNDQPARQSWINKFFNGEVLNYRYTPVMGYTVVGNHLHISKYIDDDTSVLLVHNIDSLLRLYPGKTEDFFTKRKFLLGTDSFGRDMLSRLMIGTRVSLSVGVIAVIVSLLLGIFLGAIAGYYRKRVDAVISWFINVTWSIPTLLMVFAITMAIGKGFWQIFLAIGFTLWVGVARLVRGQVLASRELEYVQAAKTLGFNNYRIIFKHILPNIMGPVTVLAAANFATAIIIEAGLSFLGIGIQAPQPSWGLMIKENYSFIITEKPLLALMPGFAIMLLVLCINLLGNGWRDAIDVRND